MKHFITFIVVSSLLIHPNYSYAQPKQSASSTPAPTKNIPNEKTDLVNYLNDVLLAAGFPDATRRYLVNTAKPQLSNIDPNDRADKTRLLKRNLYIFLNNTAKEYQTPTNSDIIRKEYFLAEQYDQPWDYILSKEVLHSFKSSHIFDRLTIEDIININAKFCPIWPLCKEN